VHPTRHAARVRRLSMLLATIAAAACSKSPIAAAPHEAPAALAFTAAVPDVQVQTVVVTVTASDIPAPVVYSFPVRNGLVTGEMSAPAGAGRTITAEAFDAGGVTTYRGSSTVALRAGSNPPLTITMLSLVATLPITVGFGSPAVVVTPAVDTLVVGDSLRFKAAVVDEHGAAVTAPVRWATDNPGLAAVDASGMVTAHLKGTVSVVATFQGTAGRATLLVR
jgi:uncharacterized protein YjdB